MILSQLLKIISKNFKIFDYRKKNIEINQRKNETKIEALAKSLIKKLRKRKLFLAIMESCTGGGLADAITNVVGASDVFKGGFVTYSNQEKINRGVSKKLIKKYSVYSLQVALAMAHRAIKEIKGTQIGIGITGSLSRKDPRNPNSQVGEVFITVIFRKNILARHFLFPSLKSRAATKTMIIYQALKMLNEIIG